MSNRDESQEDTNETTVQELRKSGPCWGLDGKSPGSLLCRYLDFQSGRKTHECAKERDHRLFWRVHTPPLDLEGPKQVMYCFVLEKLITD